MFLRIDFLNPERYTTQNFRSYRRVSDKNYKRILKNCSWNSGH